MEKIQSVILSAMLTVLALLVIVLLLPAGIILGARSVTARGARFLLLHAVFRGDKNALAKALW